MACWRLKWLRSERQRHIDALWRERVLETPEGAGRRARRRFRRLMRRFDTEDIRVLARAVVSYGHDARECALGPPMDIEESRRLAQDESVETELAFLELGVLPRQDDIELTAETHPGLIPQIDRSMSLPFLCCKLWRWRELQVDAALHQLAHLPWCRFNRVIINGSTVSCCNPYHYALWATPDSTEEDCSATANGVLPAACNSRSPSSALDNDSLGDEFKATRENINSRHGHSEDVWAKLAQWEVRERVGDWVAVTGAVAVVGQSSFYDSQHCAMETTDQELGFALIRRPPNDVWLYNAAARPLFVSSLHTVRRLSPGYCIRVHHKLCPTSTYLTITQSKHDHHRLFVTECPSRFEIVFL